MERRCQKWDTHVHENSTRVYRVRLDYFYYHFKADFKILESKIIWKVFTLAKSVSQLISKLTALKLFNDNIIKQIIFVSGSFRLLFLFIFSKHECADYVNECILDIREGTLIHEPTSLTNKVREQQLLFVTFYN